MRKKQMASCCLCTAAMVLLLGKTAYAWEPVDTNGDGVLDSIMFCDGYCDSIECSDGHDGYIGWASGSGARVYNKWILNWFDEECRKEPGYVKRVHEKEDVRRQEEKAVSEIGHQMEAKMDEIAGQCFNDSMTIIEKVYAALEYFKANYAFDDNAPEISDLFAPTSSGMAIQQEFLMKTRVLNREQRNRMIQEFVLPDYGSGRYSTVEGDYYDGDRRYYTLKKYFPHSAEERFRFYVEPMVINKRFYNYYIDGKLYTLDIETLELTEGWTEEMKQELGTPDFCRVRIADISAYGPETWKWIPEEFNKFLKDNGCHAPWMQ